MSNYSFIEVDLTQVRVVAHIVNYDLTLRIMYGIMDIDFLTSVVVYFAGCQIKFMISF